MEQKVSEIYRIPLGEIDVPNGFNSRIDFGDIDELARQIKENGQLQPITVGRYQKEQGGDVRYMLVDGERRLRALRKIAEEGGDTTALAVIRELKDVDDETLLSEQYLKNTGKNFSDWELATLCRKMLNGGSKKSEIARRLGKNPGHITYLLDIFNWDQRIQDMIRDGEIGVMQAHRMYKANRAKYGEENAEEHFTEELLKLHEKNVGATEEGSKKASINESDIYGDFKDTKVFIAGWKMLLRYNEFYKKKAGKSLGVNPLEVFKSVTDKDNPQTLKDVFEAYVAAATKETA